MSNTTGATCGAGSAYPSGAPEITPSLWWGSCCLLFGFLCCVVCTIVCLFVFFIFSHGVVSLFSIYEFDCPYGIFRPSFKGRQLIQVYMLALFKSFTWLSNCLFASIPGVISTARGLSSLMDIIILVASALLLVWYLNDSIVLWISTGVYKIILYFAKTTVATPSGKVDLNGLIFFCLGLSFQFSNAFLIFGFGSKIMKVTLEIAAILKRNDFMCSISVRVNVSMNIGIPVCN